VIDHPEADYDVLVPGAFHVPNGAGDEPYLIGGYCKESDLTIFPKMALCPACHREMDTRPIGRRGRLYSYTIAHVAPQGFEAPYFQAYVEIPEGPRVFALIADEVPVTAASLAEGMEMELLIEPARIAENGRPVLTYKYRPARRDGEAR